MTAVTTSVRAKFKSALIGALAAHPALANIQVSYGWPGDTLAQDAVWTARCTGTVSMNLLQAGRKQRDDLFDLTIVINTGSHGLEPDQSELAVTGYLAALEDVVANDPSLALTGIIAISDLAIDGPNTIRTQEGAMSWFEITISVHARYT